MDFRTPCQVLLGLLLAGVAFSVLGLAADNVSFVNSHPSPVDVHYTRWNPTAHKQYSYWVRMNYVPSRFNMGTMHAMIVACIVCGIVGVAVAVGSLATRGNKALGTSFRMTGKRTPSFLPTSLILTSVALLTNLAVAIYVWHTGMQWPNAFQNSLPLPPHKNMKTTAAAARYQSQFVFNPETWNCYLSSYVVGSTQGQRLQGLCHEAQVARYLMLPVLLLSAALLSCLVWSWRQARLAAISDAANVNGKEIEEISVQGKE